MLILLNPPPRYVSSASGVTSSGFTSTVTSAPSSSPWERDTMPGSSETSSGAITEGVPPPTYSEPAGPEISSPDRPASVSAPRMNRPAVSDDGPETGRPVTE
jgi:hypothetical protein